MSKKIFENICIITDLDDTLLNSDHSVSYENRIAIQEFIQGGGQFGIATGRGAQSVCRLDIPTTLPSILYNGSTIMDLKSSDILWNCPLETSSADILENLISHFPDAGFEIFTFDGIYIIKDNKESQMHMAIEQFVPLSLDNHHFLQIPGAWQKILVTWDDKNLAYVEQHLNNLISEKHYPIKFQRSFPILLELVHLNCGKNIALEQLAETLSIPLQNIIAIGDNQNDIGFLKTAGTGIAVSNALTEVKDIADYITVSNDEHIMVEITRLLKQNFSLHYKLNL